MPLIKDVSLTVGTNYLVAITGYRPYLKNNGQDSMSLVETGPSSIPLPASFFVAGAGAVTLDGATAAVPEPGQVAASLMLLGGIGGYVFLKRYKAAKAAVPAVA